MSDVDVMTASPVQPVSVQGIDDHQPAAPSEKTLEEEKVQEAPEQQEDSSPTVIAFSPEEKMVDEGTGEQMVRSAPLEETSATDANACEDDAGKSEQATARDEPSIIPIATAVADAADDGEPDAADPSLSEDAPTSQPFADAVYNDSSDSDDSEDDDVAHFQPALVDPSLPPASSTAASAVNNPYLHLEEEIALEDRRDREYAVPHLSSISFDTPVSSAPSTPFSPPEPALVAALPESESPFLFDPTLILIPDSHRFARSSLPLLYPKLTLTLASATIPLHVRLAALSACVDLSRDPLHLPHMLSHGVVDELIINAGWADEDVRTRATEALLYVVGRREGREYALTNGLVARVSTMLIDQCVAVRSNACHVLLRVAEMQPRALYEEPVSAAAGDAASLLTFLIRRLQTDLDAGVRVALLRCIKLGLRRKPGLVIARSNELPRVIAETIASLPQSPPPVLLQAIAEVLAAVAGEDEGKEELVAEGLQISLLAWTAYQGAVGVRLSAATALMHATVGVAMKHAVVRGGGVDLCVARIQGAETDRDVQCALLQLLANLMETAKAKAQLLHDVLLQSRVQTLAASKAVEDKALVRSAQAVLYKYEQWQR